jgi:hypothetical protein
MLSQTVQHPIIMYIVGAILISKTCLLYRNYGFGIIIIQFNLFIHVLDNNHKSQLQPSRREWYKIYIMKYKRYKDKRQI